MTPKDKAKELIYMFYNETYDISNHWSKSDRELIFLPIAKQCALKAVDEMINEFDSLQHYRINYWKEVKNEIKNYDTNGNLQ